MNITQLDQDVDFLCGSTSATYTPTDKRRNMNIHYQDTARLIWESSGGFDDTNNTDGPVAYRTLGNLSASYTIPTTALRIKGIEVRDSTGTLQKLRPIKLGDLTVSPDNYLTGSGMPTEYMVEGNEIRLFPAPATDSVTMASGMAVRLSRAVTELPVSATTETPGFATPFHRILSLATAVDFTQDKDQAARLEGQKTKLQQGLTRFYSKHIEEYKSILKPSGKNRWRQYL